MSQAGILQRQGSPVPTEYCYHSLCLVPLYSTAPRIYAFANFIAGLALLALTWTYADIRYQFRIRCTRIPLRLITFGVLALIGPLILLTDLWYAEHWLVLRGPIITPPEWEALLAAVFLVTIITWAGFAFVWPPTFGKTNAQQYARALYWAILQGSPSELPMVAGELTWSASSLVRYASNQRIERTQNVTEQPAVKLPDVEALANDLLLLIGNRRFCRTIVRSSPVTAMAVFESMLDENKFGVPVGTFAVNIFSEAINDRDSFIYTEAEGYNSGLLGYHKPLTEAMFGNYELVDTVGRMFEPDWRERRKWDADQWAAYYRAVLTTAKDYVANHFHQHSSVLYTALKHSEEALFDLYKLDGQPSGAWESDALSRLHVIVRFIRDVLEVLDENAPKLKFNLRTPQSSKRKPKRERETFIDFLAEAIAHVVWSAAGVRSSRDLCWSVQYGGVWSDLFSDHSENGAVSKAVRFKVRRLIYDKITHMATFANFEGARFLGFCLNVMGLREPERDKRRGDMWPLHRAVLHWTKKHYAWLHGYNPRVAEHCLVEGMTYDAEKRRITNTSPVDGLRRTPYYVHLDVDAPSPDAPKP